jgi:hypothetical protein
MKYRIRQVGNKFYPEGKILGLVWNNFCNGIYEKRTHLNSLDEARDYLDKLAERDAERTTIHNYP